MISAALDFALVERLERDVDEAVVAAAGVGVDVKDGGIGLDDVDELEDGIVHERERGVLRALHAADDRASVLLREETFRHAHDDDYVERDDEHQNGEHEDGIVEHPAQGVRVFAEDEVEEAFAERDRGGRVFRRRAL